MVLIEDATASFANPNNVVTSSIKIIAIMMSVTSRSPCQQHHTGARVSTTPCQAAPYIFLVICRSMAIVGTTFPIAKWALSKQPNHIGHLQQQQHHVGRHPNPPVQPLNKDTEARIMQREEGLGVDREHVDILLLLENCWF